MTKPYKIMFVCLGNICRSPMAELLLKDLVEKAGRGEEFIISSSATSDEEIGNGVYPPVKALLEKKGISCAGKRAQRLTRADGERYDLFLCMDDNNIRNAQRILGENGYKCKKLLGYAGESGNVADPWYTRDFERTYQDIYRSLQGLLRELA